MATLNGAKALGIADQVGSIEPGKRADFIVINTDAPHLTPVWNPVASVVFAAQGSDVDTVVIAGRAHHARPQTADAGRRGDPGGRAPALSGRRGPRRDPRHRA